MIIKKTIVAAVLLILSALCPMLYAQSAELDQHFGTFGAADVDYDGFADTAFAVAVDANGNIYVGGYGSTTLNPFGNNPFGNVDILVAKFKPNGTLDTSFNANGLKPGIAVYDSGGNEFGYAIALDSNGNIFVGGQLGTGINTDFIIVKFKSTGVLDQTFGTNGAARFDYKGGDDQVNSIALDSSGNIYAAGWGATNGGQGANAVFIVAKFDSKGALDHTFGTNGAAVFDKSANNENTYANGVTLDASGNIYATGYITTNFGDVLLIKFNSTGMLDTSFNANGATPGVATPFDFEGDDDRGYGVALDSGGNIFVSGFGTKLNSLINDVLVLKYLPSGTLDTTFNPNGTTPGVVDYEWQGGGDQGAYMALDSQDNPIVSATATDVFNNSHSNLFVIKFSGQDGSVVWWKQYADYFVEDRTIDAGGIGIAVSGDNIYAVDSFAVDLVVVKFNQNSVVPQLDSTFGTNGVATKDYKGNSDAAKAVALDTNGNVYAAGLSNNGVTIDLIVTKFNSAGVLDTTFNAGGAPAGVAVYSDSVNGVSSEGLSVTLGAAGEVYVAGYIFYANWDFLLVKFKSDGTLDTTFGGANTGAVSYDYKGKSDFAQAVALDANGNVYVTGYGDNGTNNDILLLKYINNGTLDQSFGTAGVAVWDSTKDDFGQGVAIDSNGNIYLSAQSYGVAGNIGSSSLVVLKFDSSGTQVTSGFGTNGVASCIGFGYGIALNSGGSIFVFGHDSNGSNDDLIVAKFTSAGALDTTFGTGGVARYDGGSDDDGFYLALDSQGNPVVAGNTKDITNNGKQNLIAVKFNAADGTILWHAKYINANNGNSVGYGMALAPNGSVFAVDTNGPDLYVAKFAVPGGKIQTSSGTIAVTCTGGTMQSLEVLDTTTTSTDTATLSGFESAPVGVFDFTVNCAKGASVDTTLDLSAISGITTKLSGTKWMWYNPNTKVWTDATGHVTDEGGGKYKINAVDGGFGDDDGIVNGIISDPIGPVVVSSGSGGGSSGGGGGGVAAGLAGSGGGGGCGALGLDAVALLGLACLLRRKCK